MVFNLPICSPHAEAFVRNSGALPKGAQKNLKNRSFTWVRAFLLTIRQIQGELAVFCNPGAKGNWRFLVFSAHLDAFHTGVMAVFMPAPLRGCVDAWMRG